MTDQRPDIDIEAERPVFEQDAAAAGWATDRDETGRYWSTMTDFRWRGWLARARIAAERERQLLDLLEYARFDECTKCYSDAVGLQCCYPHSDLCRQITAALKKGPSDGR